MTQTRHCVIITGTRYATWGRHEHIVRTGLDHLNLKPGDVVIHGGARGVDRMAECVISESATDASVVAMPAQWNVHGRAAETRRNEEMCAVAQALRATGYGVLVLAFPAANKPSPGTQHMIDCAKLYEFHLTRLPLEVEK